MIKNYMVECKYKGDWYFSDRNSNFKLDRSIEKLSPKKHGGTGLGFGYRDHTFFDLSRVEADKIAKGARKIKGVTAVIRLQKF